MICFVQQVRIARRRFFIQETGLRICWLLNVVCPSGGFQHLPFWKGSLQFLVPIVLSSPILKLVFRQRHSLHEVHSSGSVRCGSFFFEIVFIGSVTLNLITALLSPEGSKHSIIIYLPQTYTRITINETSST